MVFNKLQTFAVSFLVVEYPLYASLAFLQIKKMYQTEQK